MASILTSVNNNFTILFSLYFSLIEDAGNLDSSYTSVLRKHWTCPTCERGLVVTLMERLQHEAECSAGIDEGMTIGHSALRPPFTHDVVLKLREKDMLGK